MVHSSTETVQTESMEKKNADLFFRQDFLPIGIEKTSPFLRERYTDLCGVRIPLPMYPQVYCRWWYMS